MKGKEQSEFHASRMKEIADTNWKASERTNVWKRREALIELFNKRGMTVREIAKKYNVPPNLIRYALKKHGLWESNNHIVKSIEFLGYRDVYDMHVEKYNNFCANGIFVHNSGKTKIAAMLFSCLKGKVCLVVDQLVLLEQAKSDLEEELGEEVGWVGKSEFEPRRVTVATRQTMFRHRSRADFKRWTRDLEVLVIDEIHEQMNKSNFSVVEKIMPKAVFGLTATLQLRKKYVRLKAFALAGPVVYQYPLVQGQEEGVLAQGISVSIGYRNPMLKKEMSYRVFNRRWRKWESRSRWKELYDEMIVDNDERNYLIAALVKKTHERGKYIIVLVTRLRHLANLSKRLMKIPHRIVSGTFEGKTMKVKDRLIAKKNFEKGKIRLILANTVFKKGITIPRLDVIIDAAAGKSEDDAVQKFGRGIGLHKNKFGLLHFDIHDFDGSGNLENYFYLSSRSRMKALENAGVEIHRCRWENETDTKTILDKAERWLERRVNRGA
jgi:superfamily II DNA or RNA helicase